MQSHSEDKITKNTPETSETLKGLKVNFQISKNIPPQGRMVNQ